MRRDDGFTLAELLVALVVMGMMGVMIVSGVGTGRRVWERMDSGSSWREAVEGAQLALRNRLEGAYPQTRFDSSAPYSDFAGNAKTVTFLAEDAAARRPSALRRYRLMVGVSGDLILSSVSDLAADDNPPRDDTVLLHNVQSIDVAYFGAAPPDNVPRWRLEWEKRPTLPQLVRVRVQFAPGDTRWWPDLIVHPAATVDTRCVLDFASHRCQGRG